MATAIDINKKYSRINGYMPLEQARRAGVLWRVPMEGAKMSVREVVEMPPETEQPTAEAEIDTAQKEAVAPMAGGRAIYGATGL